jgi:hypothetical protein
VPYRVSFFFYQQGDRLGGWSENFWSVLPTISAASIEAANLVGLLQGTKGYYTYLTTVRVSDVANFRLTQIQRVVTSPSNPLAIQLDSDYQTTRAQLRLVTVGSAATNQWLAGNPDSCVTAGGRWTPISPWLSAFNALIGRMSTTANGWAIRKLDPANQRYNILAISPAAVLTTTATPYTIGSVVRVRVSRVAGYDINGLWNAAVLTSTTLQLLGYAAPAVTPVYTGGKGTIQLQSWVYPPISNGYIVRASEHKVGRPFGQLTGRRRTRQRVGVG